MCQKQRKKRTAIDEVAPSVRRGDSVHVGARPKLDRLALGVLDVVLLEVDLICDLLRELMEVRRRANVLVGELGVGAAVDDAEDAGRRVVVLVSGLDGRERLVVRGSVGGGLLGLLVSDGVDLDLFRLCAVLLRLVLRLLRLEESGNQGLDDPALSAEVDEHGRHRVDALDVELLEEVDTREVLARRDVRRLVPSDMAERLDRIVRACEEHVVVDVRVGLLGFAGVERRDVSARDAEGSPRGGADEIGVDAADEALAEESFGDRLGR